jgi:hypothetical protein
MHVAWLNSHASLFLFLLLLLLLLLRKEEDGRERVAGVEKADRDLPYRSFGTNRAQAFTFEGCKTC